MFGNRYRRKKGLRLMIGKFGRIVRWTARIVLVFLIVDLFYLSSTWPDWKRIATAPIPKSNFMAEYQESRRDNKDFPPLHWRPISFSSIPAHVSRAVVLAEDSRFYDHSGFDLIAFKEAMNYNLDEGKFVFGASTISQQTVKNLFLSSARNPLRKWHELILTWGMEQNLSKERILEVYLNIAEFGQGIFGVEAAARAYWHVPVSQLSLNQAAELAATLPSPIKHNPATRTRQFERRAKKILGFLLRFPGPAGDSVRADLFNNPMDRWTNRSGSAGYRVREPSTA
jgi:monofunctional biosynthetic peptidoglycan transglycosylase